MREACGLLPSSYVKPSDSRPTAHLARDSMGRRRRKAIVLERQQGPDEPSCTSLSATDADPERAGEPDASMSVDQPAFRSPPPTHDMTREQAPTPVRQRRRVVPVVRTGRKATRAVWFSTFEGDCRDATNLENGSLGLLWEDAGAIKPKIGRTLESNDLPHSRPPS